MLDVGIDCCSSVGSNLTERSKSCIPLDGWRLILKSFDDQLHDLADSGTDVLSSDSSELSEAGDDVRRDDGSGFDVVGGPKEDVEKFVGVVDDKSW